ncbi:AraC family transcriptional regulator [Paenibacillus sp. sptzw28]|uniref:AraC family transcriptional regulator n=1 Tax=Paenibacillus sp. sptzw28 TaxID=715179 RepID=UPI001C6EE82E|nr:AraC family transcriptional regulator [Paenibacillus sp. sptzw28]QYR22863.1 AraC family transcriptional regulator [Paenibacillus sp. sptzw28]
MYRLLIADDEALEREGLEWIVKRMMPDTFEVLHAENGRIAIERAEEFRPHIIMMDVNMPGIQGLAALREIKERLPDTKMVLVTAYDYFAYAKEALSLGVKEYIVKPASREQVVTILKQLVDELDREKNKRAEELSLLDKVSQLLPLVENELALMFMVDQVMDADAGQLSEWLDFPLDQGAAIVVAFPDFANSQDKKRMYDIIRSFTKTQDSVSVVSSLIDRHMAIFMTKSPGIRDNSWTMEMKQFGEKLCALTGRQQGLTVSIGIGTARSGYEGLRKSYFEAVFASTYFEESGRVCLFDELRREEHGYSSRQTGHNPANDDTARQSYVISALQRIREDRERQTLTVLDRAKGFIQGRFTEDLSLEEVAEFVHLNPHYFSKVFKQQVGETFIDYVTGLRIDRAKELMASEDLSLKEVCYEVGYKDPNYFSRVFKKVTGVTPTEFRGGQTK